MTKIICFFNIGIILFFAQISSAGILKGTVTNTDTNDPIAFASLLIVETNKTVMTNEDGGFEIRLPQGLYNVQCTHIAYYTYKTEVDMTEDTVTFDFSMHPSLIELPEIKVYDRNYDAAQEIIIEAIRNKDKILAKLNSYSFDAYTKLSVWNANNLDSLKPLIITETELTAYWNYPNRYKEVIKARKQSSNMNADDNLVTIGKILNFNNNRIDFGENQLVSPTANDALDYYNYYLLDTLYYDSLAVFLLEVEPKSKTIPLFEGTIRINSVSYEVMGVDIKINEGLDNPYLKKLQLVQEYRLFDNHYWMPTIIKYDGLMEIPFPLIPSISFSYTAGLQQYVFEQTYGDTIFNDYVLEVDKKADDIDSTVWLSNRFIPLTLTEELAYQHIDSVEKNQPLLKKLLPIIPASLYILTSSKDFFHFNRVEGAYLGGKLQKDIVPEKLTTDMKLGYAFDAEYWQYYLGLEYKLSQKKRVTIGASMHDNVHTRNTINSEPNGNATAVSLFLKHDQYDYFKEKGAELFASFAPLKQTTFKMTYNNYSQDIMYNKTNYAFFFPDSTYRANLPIIDGRLKSVQFDFEYDSNKRIKDKGKEKSIFSYPYTNFKFGVEISDTATLSSDFEFKALHAKFYTTRQMYGLGISSLSINATKKLSGQLPPQRYSVMDFGGMILEESMHFLTLNQTNFTGDNVYSIYYNHNFGTRLFKKSHIPLVQDIPLSLSIHGGAFWTEFSDHTYNIGDEYTLQTGSDSPYQELGFTIGRLPLMIALGFTWQLSSYDTYDFSFGFGFEF